MFVCFCLVSLGSFKDGGKNNKQERRMWSADLKMQSTIQSDEAEAVQSDGEGGMS